MTREEYEEKVIDHLMYPDAEEEEIQEYKDTKTEPYMTEEQAKELVEEHKEIIDECIRLDSFPYYAANEIIKEFDEED